MSAFCSRVRFKISKYQNLLEISYANFPLQAVRQQILQLLTPVTMNHTIVFLASLADVWHQRRRREGSGSKATRGVPVASEEQIIVVDIVYAIKVKRASPLRGVFMIGSCLLRRSH